jgi:hypothetical protein
MKRHRVVILVISAVAAAILVCMQPDLTLACVYGAYDDIDVHSADTRHRVHMFCVRTSSEIRQSLLSQEAHRLGIAIPTPRVWKLANARYLRRHADCPYGVLLKSGDTLVDAFVKARTADDERRIIVNEFLMSLRTERPHEVYRCLCGLLERVNSGDTGGSMGRSPIKMK